MLKGLVFAHKVSTYLDFLHFNHLSIEEYRLVRHLPNIQGYHTENNPELGLYLLNGWNRVPVMQHMPEIYTFLLEFAKTGRMYCGTVSNIFLMKKVKEAQNIAELPPYLAHPEAVVRETARQRFDELTKQSKTP